MQSLSQLYDELKKRYPYPLSQKHAKNMTVGYSNINFLYASKELSTGDAIVRPKLRIKISDDSGWNGQLEAFGDDENTKLEFKVTWKGYKAWLYDGDLQLCHKEANAIVMGTDINNNPFVFYRDMLIEGKWPAFLCMMIDKNLLIFD